MIMRRRRGAGRLVAELAFLAALAGDRPNGLFFAGDIGQRIFRQPFAWKSLGVDITGRSRSLSVNYRTSHAIRTRADRLLPPRLVEADGTEEERRNVVSVFEGPDPEFATFGTPDEEAAACGSWLRSRIDMGVSHSEIAVLVRSHAELPRARRGHRSRPAFRTVLSPQS